MKERELRECCDCVICKKPIGQTGVPLFYRVRVERHGLKLDAIQRQTGFAMMMGGHAEIAMHMGPDEEMTEQMMEPVEVTVCELCSQTTPLMVIALREAERDDEAARKEKSGETTSPTTGETHATGLRSVSRGGADARAGDE